MSTPSKIDRARGGLLQAHQQAAQGGLAAPGLADDAERLALVQLEAHAVDGLDLADGAAQHTALDRVVLDQVRSRCRMASAIEDLLGEVAGGLTAGSDLAQRRDGPRGTRPGRTGSAG